MLTDRTDRAWFSRLIRYDILPGNGPGQFLQPQSPHGAVWFWKALEMNHSI